MLQQTVLYLLLFLLALSSAAFSTPLLDSDGKIIRTDTSFTRIISFYGAHTRNLIDMGAEKQIVAIGRSDKQLPALPTLSFRDDPERLLALKPDLVLIRPMLRRAYPKMVERLELSGVAVVSIQPTSVDEMFRYWKVLGILSGHQVNAEEMITHFKNKLDALAHQVNKIPVQKRKRVYFESIHKRMKTFAPDSMAIFVLKSAGGINIAADAIQVRQTNIAAYSKERILDKADQIDVFLAQQGRMNQQHQT
ncbi:MAG: ABC transporter substrate-binding protein, partial [Candidatus Electrothrix sp. AR3]|nr:ABC transporter substrate-binding protein [Candidatus Electrothrix sp. AR3]